MPRAGIPIETSIETFSHAETAAVGFGLAKKAGPGDIVLLSGEMGAGKTALAAGFARGLGVAADIVSPTFTVLNEYRSGRLPLFHFDLYRLESPLGLAGIGYEEYFFGDGVSLVEWPENGGGLVPGRDTEGAGHVTFVRIEADFARDPMYRRVSIIERTER